VGPGPVTSVLLARGREWMFLDVICYTSVKDVESWAVYVGDVRQHLDGSLQVLVALGGPGTTPRRRGSTRNSTNASTVDGICLFRLLAPSVTLVEWPHATRERAYRSSCVGLRWYGTASRTRVHDLACCVRHYANIPTVLGHGTFSSPTRPHARRLPGRLREQQRCRPQDESGSVLQGHGWHGRADGPGRP